MWGEVRGDHGAVLCVIKLQAEANASRDLYIQSGRKDRAQKQSKERPFVSQMDQKDTINF